MIFHSQIEQRLWNYLSPRKQREVEDYVNAPNHCPNCGMEIADDMSFCGDGCRKEYVEEDRASDAQQPETQENIAGSGMGFRRNAQ